MAKKLYYEIMDMDFMDNAETMADDLALIEECINAFGYELAKMLLIDVLNN